MGLMDHRRGGKRGQARALKMFLILNRLHMLKTAPPDTTDYPIMRNSFD